MSYPILPAANGALMSRTRDYKTVVINPARGQVTFSIKNASGNVIKSFSDLVVSAIALNDLEASETVLTSEGEKIRVADRVLRTISISGQLIESGRSDSVNTRAAWLEFYEFSRLSQVAVNRLSVSFVVDDVKFDGAFISSDLTQSATEPNIISISTAFLCRTVEVNKVISKVPGTDFLGYVTYEGLAATNVIGPIAYQPIDTKLGFFGSGGQTFDPALSFTRDDQTVKSIVFKFENRTAAANNRLIVSKILPPATPPSLVASPGRFETQPSLETASSIALVANPLLDFRA